MKRLSLIVVAIAGVGMSQANRLIGWTDPVLGMSQAVTIDENTGEAVVIGQVPVPAGYAPYSLTYDPTSGCFYGVALATSGTAAPSKLAVIRSEDGQSNWYDIAGYPGGYVYFEGVEYAPLENSVVVSFTSPGSYLTTRLCRVNALGQMTAYTGGLPIVDADMLGVEPESGALHIFDINNPTNGHLINRIDDPFGSPSVTGIYNGSANVDTDSDIAGLPEANPYVTRGDRLGQVDFDSGTIVDIGPYGKGIPTVRGIAACLDPWTVASGKVILGDFVGDASGKLLVLFLYQGGNLVANTGTYLQADGRFTLATDLAGTFDVKVWVPGWLQRYVGTVEFDGTRYTDIEIPLTNGDIDRDNAVTVFDYNVLSDYFDRTSSDPDWNDIGPNGFAPSDADLDGDESVTVFDYNVLSNNFDLAGD